MRNPPSRVLLAAAVCVLLLAGVVAPAAGGAVAAPSTPPAQSTAEASDLEPQPLHPTPAAVTSDAAIEQTDDGFDPTTATRIRIEPTPDRDARWVVSVRYALTDEAERTAFETIGDRFQSGEIGPSADLFAGFAREASRNLDRTMQVEGAEREVVVHDDTSSFDVAGEDTVAVGELRLSFVWTAFLAQDGEDLVLGDALTTPDGTWLRSLESGQTLEVSTPDGYTVTSTTASLQENAVVIEGPRTFDADEGVAVVYASTGTPGPPWTLLAAAIVIGALIIAGSIVGYRRRGGLGDDAAGGAVASSPNADASITADAGASKSDADEVGAAGLAADGTDTKRDDATAASDDIEDGTAGEIDDSDGGPDSAESGGVSADAHPTDPTDDAETASDSAERDSGDTADSDDADEPTGESEQTDEVDRSLLSDEERVEYLLDDNGGRMRQADIVSETGWSDAKVSQLLSAMADEERVEKLRLGRENLISLPDSGRPSGGGGEDGGQNDAGGRDTGRDGDGGDRDDAGGRDAGDGDQGDGSAP
ncbi:DUF7345 domain-containing protein [Halorubrum laminariae]|uniref:Transmembrane glycoprotein / HTH domain protein n=1 Tax=Halorubrum laminariae TaxID=1433523 RepID=A0ABD6BXR4_9EURY|nr:hypothetical protein [Halorubrum laminariae]